MKEKVVEILLVEDRAEDAELAMMALEDSNMVNNVKWVKDGQEALDFLFAKENYSEREGLAMPRLILLDLKMPKVDGIEVLQQIRTNELTKLIPVVVLTTSKEDRDKVEAYKLGVNSYILKPVGFNNFLKSVKDIGFYWLLLNEPPV